MARNRVAKKKAQTFDIETFLAHCARISRADKGWMSAKDAHARNMVASADAALAAAREGASVDDGDREAARSAVAHFRERFAKATADGRLSEFDQTVEVNLDMDSVQAGTHRIVASVMGMWVRAQAPRGDQVGSLPSYHLGKIGDKIDVQVTVTHIAQIASQWGPTQAINMQTADGARVTWFSGRSTLEVGTTCRLRGTIKDLREFRGQPQTVVTRCSADQTTAAA